LAKQTRQIKIQNPASGTYKQRSGVALLELMPLGNIMINLEITGMTLSTGHFTKPTKDTSSQIAFQAQVPSSC
jgi:hypothetical protein